MVIERKSVEKQGKKMIEQKEGVEKRKICTKKN
jgi:hypothetical protein